MVVRGKMRKSRKWQIIGAQTITNGWKVWAEIPICKYWNQTNT